MAPSQTADIDALQAVLAEAIASREAFIANRNAVRALLADAYRLRNDLEELVGRERPEAC